ncbi:MAG TPA: DNA-processing protein DprA [Anaerolineales bacterium]|nr:DNA-processing protein DprA [Anaerolineales bacterium]
MAIEDWKIYWVGFNLVKGIGPIRFRSLIDHFGDASSAWHATRSDLEMAGIHPKIIDNLWLVKQSEELERIWTVILKNDIQLLTWDDAGYPRGLREIDQSPPVLYVHGSLSDEDFPSVSIVGTRRITQYGRQVTKELSAELARRGVTVVSGMARGVDAAAHQACMDAGGRTLAVLGSGVDQIYPPEHRKMAERIRSNGALISDYPPGTPPEAGNFPPRNRIIAGLSKAIVIVEAGEKSGALITAAYAADQGRDVFAVPGSVYAIQSRGANRLIQEGAHIYLGVQDLFELLNLTRMDEFKSARVSLPTDATEAQLFSLLGKEPLHVDELRYQSGLPVELVSSALTLMELKGLVRQVGSMRYVAVFESGEDYLVE